MKRMLVMTMAAVLLLSLGACGLFPSWKTEFIAGTVENGVYISEFAGLSYTPPIDWALADKETAMEKLGLPEENFSVPGKTYNRYTTLCEMYALPTPIDGSSAYILVDNMAGYREGKEMTEDQYLDILCEPAEGKEEANLTYGEPFDVVVAGQTYRAVESSVSGMGFWQRYYVRRIGSHMFVIVTIDINQPNQEAFTACFSML